MAWCCCCSRSDPVGVTNTVVDTATTTDSVGQPPPGGDPAALERITHVSTSIFTSSASTTDGIVRSPGVPFELASGRAAPAPPPQLSDSHSATYPSAIDGASATDTGTSDVAPYDATMLLPPTGGEGRKAPRSGVTASPH